MAISPMMRSLLVCALFSTLAVVSGVRVDEDAPPTEDSGGEDGDQAEQMTEADGEAEADVELTPEEGAQKILANREADTYLAAEAAHAHLHGAEKLSKLARGQLLKRSAKHSLKHAKANTEQGESLGKALKARSRHKHIASRGEAIAAYKARVEEELQAASDNLAMKERQEQEAMEAAIGAAQSEAATLAAWKQLNNAAGVAYENKKLAEENFEGKTEAMEQAAIDAGDSKERAKKQAFEHKVAANIEAKKRGAKAKADGIKLAADAAAKKAIAKESDADSRHAQAKHEADKATVKKVKHVHSAQMYAQKDCEAGCKLAKAKELVEDLTTEEKNLAQATADAQVVPDEASADTAAQDEDAVQQDFSGEAAQAELDES